MIKFLLIIFLSITVFSHKSYSWVGVWLGLEAGIAVLNGVTEELSNSKSYKAKKKSNVICINENGHQINNLKVCPSKHKTIYLDNSYDLNKSSSSIREDNNKKTVYCRNTKTNIFYKPSNKVCANNSVQVSKTAYDAFKGKNNNDISNKKKLVGYTYCKGINTGKVYQTSNTNCYSNAKEITKKEYLSFRENVKSNFITKKDNEVTYSYCRNNNGKVYKTSSTCPPKKNITEEEYYSEINKEKNIYITKKDNKETFCRNTISSIIYKLQSVGECYNDSVEVSKTAYEAYIGKSNVNEGITKFVSVNKLNLRDFPNGNIITSFPFNTELVIKSKNTIKKSDYVWVNVQDKFGNEGWVVENFLSLTKNNLNNNSSFSFTSINEDNYLNVLIKDKLKNLNISQYKNKNIESLTMCKNDNYKDNCYGTAYISNDELIDPADGCDFKYEGGFKNNTYHGFSTYSYYNCTNSKDNFTYVGYVKDGQRHGLGQAESGTNEISIGLFNKDDFIFGSLKFHNINQKYYGELKSNYYEGLGEYEWDNGDIYTGYFKNGNKNGKGIF